MTDGNGNSVRPWSFTDEDRVRFIESFLQDERSVDEFKQILKHLERAQTVARKLSDDDDAYEICYELDEAILNAEAIIAYESGVFHGNDYWAETYWDNYKKCYSEEAIRLQVEQTKRVEEKRKANALH